VHIRQIKGINKMERITLKDLEIRVARLNKLANIENPSWNKIGSYLLDGAYGGYELQKVVNTSGGVTCRISSGHVSKKELYSMLNSFIAGLETR
jgi:hypothetical protein